jgi:uncharacterized protein YnzC (UPF0291/DUF896 family)
MTEDQHLMETKCVRAREWRNKKKTRLLTEEEEVDVHLYNYLFHNT